ncbi:MAG: Holliday junction branch migration protein RuvA [Caenispirillum sp.]|nr:Holliday junction branch migration protein RuvA [Caenispirillum sp.]
MIAKLKGLIDSLGDDWAVVDVNGVGYLVFCSGRTLGKLAVGEAAALEVETHVREDHIHLYGFADRGERDAFRLLTTVQGVGAKVALAILSVATPQVLAQAIAAGDKAPLVRASGVGPKLAARILSELKDKAATLGAAFVPAPAPGVRMPVAAEAGDVAVAGSVTEDATSALVNLGYRRMEAFAAVARAAQAQGEAASVSSLVTAALKDLAQL